MWPFKKSSKHKIEKIHDKYGKFCFEDERWVSMDDRRLCLNGKDNEISEESLGKLDSVFTLLPAYESKCIIWMNENTSKDNWSVYMILIDVIDCDCLIEISNDQAEVIYGFKCKNNTVILDYSDD